jgi:hypothetical protein
MAHLPYFSEAAWRSELAIGPDPPLNPVAAASLLFTSAGSLMA